MPILPPVAPIGTEDPNNSQKGGGRQGGVGDSGKRGEFGTIIAFDANTYSALVRTERGRTINVGYLRSSPGEIKPLPTGTEVAISWEYGPPIITGCISIPASRNEGTPSFSITDADGFGGQGANQAESPDGNYRRPGEPTDLIPGDWAQVGTGGNGFTVLGGGTSTMKSSPLAQIRTHSIGELVEIFSRNFRHITDMGESRITNDGGKNNWSFRGGVSQRTEAGPDEEKWTIQVDLGSVGDLFNFELTTLKGQTLFKFHVDASGHCEIFGINGVNVASGNKYSGTHTEEHAGDSSKAVGGNQTATVEGSGTHTYGSTLKEVIGGNREVSVSNDIKAVAVRDIAVAAGRAVNLSVTGPFPPLPKVQDAVTADIATGNLTLNVGSALTASIPYISNYNLNVFAGDITNKIATVGNISNSTIGGEITNSSLRHVVDTHGFPASVVLGGPVAGSQVVKYEELLLYLQHLHSLIDSHIHLIGAATAGPFPVVGLTDKPLIPTTPQVAGDLLTFRSLTTGVAV